MLEISYAICISFYLILKNYLEGQKVEHLGILISKFEKSTKSFEVPEMEPW
jgi:hypothetical protein